MANYVRPLCCDICAKQIAGDMIKLNIKRYFATNNYRSNKDRTVCSDCWNEVVSCIEDLIDERSIYTK